MGLSTYFKSGGHILSPLHLLGLGGKDSVTRTRELVARILVMLPFVTGSNGAGVPGRVVAELSPGYVSYATGRRRTSTSKIGASGQPGRSCATLCQPQ